MWLWSLPLIIWPVGAFLLAFISWREVYACWREPVLKRPVLIVESDDWGPGPAAQTDGLIAIADVLKQFRDRDGRHPVVTLALVLSTAAAIRRDSGRELCSVGIMDHRYDELRTVLVSGQKAGIFALQLHGKAHFWPPVLAREAANNPEIAAWVEKSPNTGTEELPPKLQSRWIDASVLPSRSLPVDDIIAAAREEIEYFESCFGFRPAVAVPPTFVWNDSVEHAWREAGIQAVVTPGKRFESRDGDGHPASDGTPIVNGDRSSTGVLYLVRDEYFEPEKGHTVDRALASLARKTRLGRPTLLETHRSNFLEPEQRETAVEKIHDLYERVLRIYPSVAFVSTERLARMLETMEPDWFDKRWNLRLQVSIERLWALPQVRKLMWLTTLILPVGLVWALLNWLGSRRSLA